MSGCLIGVGVGPGDPQLMTLKAIKTIEENNIIALPGKCAKETVAYKIAVQAVPSLAQKTLLSLDFPMTKDTSILRESHVKAAMLIEEQLKLNENVVFLSLGDIAIYSTFAYVQSIVEDDGYETSMVNGIPSFCAAAAAINKPLVIGDETMLINPYDEINFDKRKLQDSDCIITMKSPSKIKEACDKLSQADYENYIVSNCSTPNEAIYTDPSVLPQKNKYLTLLISKRVHRDD